MTSEERRAGRYRRRCERREAKKRERLVNADNFSRVFNFTTLYKAYRECRKGVTWKASVQRYMATAPISIAKTLKKLNEETYRSPGFFEFDLTERGKTRHIRSTVIGERVVQRCLCDNALIPAIEPSFIHDNGASMKWKGYDFAVRRFTQMLQRHYRKHGAEGYVLLFDFSKFFDNVSHKILEQILNKCFTDEKLKRLTMHFIGAFGERGLGLGSQISQVLALASANRLDHYIKEVLRIKAYERYMDDGALIHRSKEYLKTCLAHIRRICELLEIKLNLKKTQIVKLTHGFVWLKVRFTLLESGKIIRKICKASITRRRRQLKKLKKKLDAGKIKFTDIWASWQSWRGYARRFDSWRTVHSMGELFNRLFICNEEGLWWYDTSELTTHKGKQSA